MSRSSGPAFVLALSLPAVPLVAQIPPNYYATVNASTPATLRATLHAVIDDHTRFPYTASGTDTWVILEQADENPANAAAIVDVYRNASYAKIGGGTGPYNREHTWPSSYGFPSDSSSNYPFTDCHQLFLCDGGYNSSRGNRAFAVAAATANEQVTVSTNGTGGGIGVYPGNSNWTDSVTATGRWEVWRERRGDVARALLYLDVRYEGGTHTGSGAAEPNLILTDDVALIAASNTGNNEPVAYMGQLTTLLQWHQLDPVDQRERDRNDLVYSYQGNRNPFVDHPEWAGCLFAATCSNLPPAAPANLTCAATKSTAALDWPDNGEPDLAGYRVYRATLPGGPYAQIAQTAAAVSNYTDVGQPLVQGRYYVVRAVDTAGSVSSASREVRATGVAVARTVIVDPPPPAGVWINELHYDNAGADQGEFVEVAGAGGLDLAGYSLVAYNGNGGASYATVSLSGVIPSQQNGWGARSFSIAGLQNGAPDGVALVNPGGVVLQFLAYEGAFTAVGGPANGMQATAIPTAESEATPVGFSLQLQGAGNGAGAFVWSSPLAATPGAPNVGQTLQ